MTSASLLLPTPCGLYCPSGDFFIDPSRAVPRALITHAHADHARAGHGSVAATQETLDLMRIRYGAHFTVSEQALAYGETVSFGTLSVSLHPAGHVLGSAQILLQTPEQRLVITGDYKRCPDPTCAPFEVIPCDALVTEATFGLPVFRHPPPEAEIQKLLTSLKNFPDRAHLVSAYSLGKAQRILALLYAAGWERPIFIHSAMEKITDYYRSRGTVLGATPLMTSDAAYAGDIVLCPPAALSQQKMARLAEPVFAMASGWMRVRAHARRNGVALPLILSDHADWNELCATVEETRCQNLWVTHGAEDALVHWAQGRGLVAKSLRLMNDADNDTTQDEAANREGVDA